VDGSSAIQNLSTSAEFEDRLFFIKHHDPSTLGTAFNSNTWEFHGILDSEIESAAKIQDAMIPFFHWRNLF
jgi:hypothetical protein